jgi:hypothetical protein
MTTRRWLIVVAIVAIALYADVLRRRRTGYLARAIACAEQAQSLELDLPSSEGELALAQSNVSRARAFVAFKENFLARGRSWNDSPSVMEQALAADRSRVERSYFEVERAAANRTTLRRQVMSYERLRRQYEFAASRPWLTPQPDDLATD